jgi:hypothetical protein
MANGNGEAAAFGLGAVVGIALIVLLIGTAGDCNVNVSCNGGGGGDAGTSTGDGCSGARTGGGCGGPRAPDDGTTAQPRPTSTTPVVTLDTSAPAAPETGDSPIDTGDGCDRAHRVIVAVGFGDPDGLATPVLARTATDGAVLQQLRTWEVFDYYDLPYPAPLTLAPALDAASLPGDEWRFQLAVVPPVVDRRPVHLAIVLDPSLPSDQVSIAESLADGLGAALRPGDTLSVGAMAAGADPTLDGFTALPDAAGVVRAGFDAVFGSGQATDTAAGLEWGLSQVAGPPAGAIARVWLIGGLEPLAEQALKDVATASAGPSGVRVGAVIFDDLSLSAADFVTRAGLGPTLLLDSSAEAVRAAARLDPLLDLAAEDLVAVELELPPGFRVDRELLPGDGPRLSVESPIPALRPLVRQLRATTCAPELATADAAVSLTVQWRALGLAEGTALDSATIDTTIGALLAQDPAPVTKGRVLLDYALWAKKPGDAGLSGAVHRSLDEADALLPGDPDLLEIRGVVEAWSPGGGSGGN